MSTQAPNRPDEEEAELTPEEAVAKAELISEARMAQVLMTGRMGARIKRILEQIPPDRHGYFERNTPEDIEAAEELGYRVETGISLKGANAGGDGRIIIGDVILLTTHIQNIETRRRIEERQVYEKLGYTKEEYKAMAASNSGIAFFDESKPGED